MNIPALTLRTAALSAVVLCLAAATTVRNASYRSATTLWESSVRCAPEKRRPHFNLGQALSREGRYPEALEQFRTVGGLPDDGTTTPLALARELGVVYLGLGLYEEAANTLLGGLLSAPGEWSLLNNLALVRRMQGRFDEAIAFARRALSADPARLEPLTILADVYMEKGEPGRAVEYLDRYLSVRPEEPRAQWGMALALRQAGRYGEALVHAERFQALERDPGYRMQADQLVGELRGAAGKP